MFILPTFPCHLEIFQVYWTHSFTKQTTQYPADLIYIRKAIYCRFTCCKLCSFKTLRCYLQHYCLGLHFYPHVESYFVCWIKGNRTSSTTTVVSSALVVVLWNETWLWAAGIPAEQTTHWREAGVAVGKMFHDSFLASSFGHVCHMPDTGQIRTMKNSLL